MLDIKPFQLQVVFSLSVHKNVLCTKVLHFDEVKFVCFFLLLLVVLVPYLRIHCQIQGHKDFSPVFFQEFYGFSSYVQIIDPFELVLWSWICKENIGVFFLLIFIPIFQEKKRMNNASKRT